MTTRFINDDALLKNGGRKAVRIQQGDLAHLMYKLGEKFFHEEWGDDEQLELPDDETWYQNECYDELIKYLMQDSTLLSDVSKYNVGCCSEATFDGMTSKGTTNLTGMHTLANGLTFYGFFLSVDCGPSCAFVIIYHDGRKLRAYMPTYGNTVNVDFKCVLGVEYEYMDNMSKIETKYKKAGIWREDEDLFRMYLAKYELDSEFCYWDAIQSDIEARIEILDEMYKAPKEKANRTKKQNNATTTNNQNPSVNSALPEYIQEFVKTANDNPHKKVVMIVDMGPFGEVTYSFADALKTTIAVNLGGNTLRFPINLVGTAINTQYMQGYRFIFE